MALVKPFPCIRPRQDLAHRIAALPYDVYNRQEAKEETLREPYSFLKIDRAETQLPNEVDIYDPKVYEKAKELLDEMISNESFITDTEECYYIYQLIMQERSQTGIVACTSIDDYQNNVIMKHEKTREDKEIDRIKHVDICNAQTGPIFLAYRSHKKIDQVISEVTREEPIYDFISRDQVTHRVWRIADKEKVNVIQMAFAEIYRIYIADGHHRAASAVKVGLKRRQENPGYTGKEEFNYFLSVLFPHDQLRILPYNRAVKDLNGLTKDQFLEKIQMNFSVHHHGTDCYNPVKKGTYGMYLDGTWYALEANPKLKAIQDPVKSLDVSLLQDYLLHPILGIEDPRTDNRIDFIGGIRGTKELERRVKTDMAVAFSMYPTSINELFAVSDHGMLMPPKSTWFEPKLRSGLFIHKLT
ncbi:MAG: DUF1015 domain-containing protein [Clostridiales bacterium]|jgi:uncharacterized protein (DUF1015 family)|nr:DUF1015 domain-containing protein [Clostridiales bacterium]